MSLFPSILKNKFKYLLIAIEAIASAYIIYIKFGLLILFSCLSYVLVTIIIGSWVISKKYETANILREPQLYYQQNFVASLKFGHFFNVFIFFPVRAVILYYIYANLEHGLLIILIYFLYTQHNQQSLIHTNAAELGNEIRK